MIPSGTRVRVTTTNGGEGVYTLETPYVPSYGIELVTDQGRKFWVDSQRLKTIEEVAQ